MICTLIVVREEDRERANGAAAALSGRESDLATFGINSGLSPNGQAPATHRWCCAVLSEGALAQVQALRPAFPGSVIAEWEIEADPELPERVLAELGLQRVEEGG